MGIGSCGYEDQEVHNLPSASARPWKDDGVI